MMISISQISAVIAAVGVLVAAVNIVVEVLKKLTWEKIPTNILAFIVSEVLTLAAFLAYCQIYAVPAAWYSVFGAIVGGIMVSYAAMFGYDKFKEALKGVQSIVEASPKSDSGGKDPADEKTENK